MSDAYSQVLILDDGELDDLAALLEDLGTDYRRLRGGEIEDGIEPPVSLLVATPRRASAVRPGSPPDAPQGRPLRVISTVEDSTPMREMLRRQGFDLLVRRPTHREVWRLLVERALYQGRERRGGERYPVGSEVEVETADAAAAPCTVLVDLSNRGGHLVTGRALAVGDRVSLSLPADAADGVPLDLRGRVVRSCSQGGRFSIGMLFDRDLPATTRQRLGSLLNSWSHGEEFAAATDRAGSLPACESPAIPGLTLDDETDPAIPTHLPVDLRGPTEGSDRRRHRRGPFVRAIEAVGQDGTAVLMGRDLSPGGMRVEPLPDLGVGDRLEVAIYGPDRPDPYRVVSEVVRDDGEEGLALAFRDVPPEVAAGLEKIVACLPDIESLQEGEAAGLGSVITEVVRRRDA